MGSVPSIYVSVVTCLLTLVNSDSQASPLFNQIQQSNSLG